MQAPNRRSILRSSISIVVLTVVLSLAGVASGALLNSSLLPWFATGGASEMASAGGGYTLIGAAGMSGAHLTTATGGEHALYGGYVPAQSVVPSGEGDSIWLPIVTGESD